VPEKGADAKVTSRIVGGRLGRGPNMRRFWMKKAMARLGRAERLGRAPSKTVLTRMRTWSALPPSAVTLPLRFGSSKMPSRCSVEGGLLMKGVASSARPVPMSAKKDKSWN
jgi:hypothetical protein